MMPSIKEISTAGMNLQNRYQLLDQYEPIPLYFDNLEDAESKTMFAHARYGEYQGGIV